MPISQAQAERIYQQARGALEAISRSRKASDAQKHAARRARDQLDMEFCGRAIANVQARTAKYQDFIQNMEALLASLQSDALVHGITTIKEIVDIAKPLVEE